MNRLTIAATRLRRLRKICLALPEATEKEAWGDPTWRVRGRIFVMLKGNHAGGRPSIWTKAGFRQDLLAAASEDLFFVPPYVGHKGWVGMYLDARPLPWPLVAGVIHDSYCLIAPRRLAALAAEARRDP